MRWTEDQLQEHLKRTPVKAKVAAKKPSKYSNVRTTVDGIAFDSKAEARRWTQLSVMAAAGLISDLKRQVPFKLEVNGIVIGKYLADFTYITHDVLNYLTVEDCKGVETQMFKWKAKHFKAQYGIEIKITK